MMPPAPQLRVLMTTDAVGGVWTFVRQLAGELCRRGFGITLVSLGPPPSADKLEDLRSSPALDLECTDLALEWMDPGAADLARAERALARINKRVRPDVIHLNSYREAGFEWGAPVLLTAHSCVRSWWHACRDEEIAGGEWETYCRHVSNGLSAADQWAAPTQWFRDRILENYAPPRQGSVIANGIEALSPAQRRKPLILAAGRLWDEAKNLKVLCSIAAKVDWPIEVAGPLRPQANGIGLADSLSWAGDLPRPKLLARLEEAEIFVSPAAYEPFGLTVLEAAAAGCALVLSDIPVFRELWDGAAIFAARRAEGEFIAALNGLARDNALRRRMQQAAAERARRYTLTAMADAYAKSYESLIRADEPATAQERAAVGAHA